MMLRWMGTVFAAVLISGGWLLAASAQQQQAQPQEKRIALVIGNSAYVKGPIATAANDAGLVAQTLQAAGFDVVGARDLDGDTLRGSFRDFIQKAEASGPDTVAMIYLAGYGVQLAGENYFIPVDSKIERDTDIPIEGLRISDYMRQLAALPIKATIVVLDAARQQPFIEDNGQIASGLALMEPDQHMLIAFNATPGTVAPDEQGNYGAYAQALAEMIRSGGLPLPELFDRVRLRVNDVTKGALVPWDAQKIDTPFVFFDRAPDAPPEATPAQTAAARDKPIRDMSAQDAYAAALDRDSLQGYEDFLGVYPDDPMSKRVRAIAAARREAITWRRSYRTDTPDAYWSYLRRYPNGPHAEDARRRLAILSAPLEAPQSFAMIDYDVPPPPPDEVVYVDRPVLMFSDPDFDFAPPPVYYLPPPPDDFIDLPPPSPPDGLFILPQPFFVPIPVFVRAPIYVSPPPHNIIFANIHNRAVIDNEINRRGPPQFNNNRGPNGPGGQIFGPGEKGPAGQRPAPQFTAGTVLPNAAQRRSDIIREGKAQPPASSFINPRVRQGEFNRQAPLPGPRKFGGPDNNRGPQTPPPQALPNRNALPVPGRAGAPNIPPDVRGPQPQPNVTNPAARITPSGEAGRGPAPGPAGSPAGPGPSRPDFRTRRPGQPPNLSNQPPSGVQPTPQFRRPQIQRPPAVPQVQRNVRPPNAAPQQVRPPAAPRAAPPQAPRAAPPQRPAPMARPAPPPRMAPPPRPAPVARPTPPPRMAPPRAAPPPRPAPPPRAAPKKCPPNQPKC